MLVVVQWFWKTAIFFLQNCFEQFLHIMWHLSERNSNCEKLADNCQLSQSTNTSLSQQTAGNQYNNRCKLTLGQNPRIAFSQNLTIKMLTTHTYVHADARKCSNLPFDAVTWIDKSLGHRGSLSSKHTQISTAPFRSNTHPDCALARA